MNIQRIEMPDPDFFHSEYMAKLRPVVIANLFQGQPIRALNSRKKAIEALGDVRVLIQTEYYDSYNTGSNVPYPIEEMSIADYFAFVDTQPNTTKMCIECPSPSLIKSLFEVPRICISQPGESVAFVNQIFIGNRNNVANIHFDKAGLHGLLYQVFGRKRFIVFPQSASHKLAPNTQASSWLLQRFSDADRKAFLRFTGGEEVILDAGDCMYVPALSWHFVDYIDDSMSISLRFRRSQVVTDLINALFPDMYLQGIAYKVCSRQMPEEERAFVLTRIKAASCEKCSDGFEKVRSMRKVARDLYRHLYPGSPPGPYTLDPEEFFPPLLANFLNADDPRRPKYV